MYVQIDQNTENGIEDVTNPTARAQPSHQDDVKDKAMAGQGPITKVIVGTISDPIAFVTLNRLGGWEIPKSNLQTIYNRLQSTQEMHRKLRGS